MKLGGFQKSSLLDYPDEISAIIWTVKCNFHCPFCYNTDIVDGKVELFSEEEILDFLKKRQGLLDALVISGGEPLLQKDITSFCEKVKKLGYKIKIDTNGTFPVKLQELIDKKLVDYISMDVKAPVDKYNSLAGKKVDISKIKKSIKIIQQSGVDYEFKTTVVPGLLDKNDIIEIGKWLNGSKKYYLQQFKNDTSVISSDLEKIIPYSKDEILDFVENVKQYFDICKARGI